MPRHYAGFFMLIERPLLAVLGSPDNTFQRPLWGKQTLKLDKSTAIYDPKR